MTGEKPRLNLAMIRSADIHRSAEFYRLLGLGFKLHRHGTGPEHYSFENSGAVFEIYPLATKGNVSTGLRIGFAVSSVDFVLSGLESSGAVIISLPSDSPWGRRAVVQDPDGYKVDLIEQQSDSTASR